MRETMREIMAKRPRIAVVGSANVDLTTFSDRFPKPGETIFGDKFDLGFGGKGANQAVAARLCGAEVFMVARVGDDLFGPATITNFEKLGIDASHVRIVRGVSSGVAPDLCRVLGSEPDHRGEGRERYFETGGLWMRLPMCSRAQTASCSSSRSRWRRCITRFDLRGRMAFAAF